MTSKTDQLSALVEHGADTKGNIVLSGEVNDEMVDRLVRALISLGPTRDLHIRLNSGGGDTSAALAIYDLLRDHRAHVTMTVTSCAYSAAVAILQAADDRVVLPNASLMVHEGTLEYPEAPANDVKASLAWEEKVALKYDRIVLARVQEKKPGVDRKTIVGWNAKTRYFTAEDAVEWGLADRVQYPDAGSHLDDAG